MRPVVNEEWGVVIEEGLGWEAGVIEAERARFEIDVVGETDEGVLENFDRVRVPSLCVRLLPLIGLELGLPFFPPAPDPDPELL